MCGGSGWGKVDGVMGWAEEQEITILIIYIWRKR